MKGLSKEKLLQIIQSKDFDVALECDMTSVFKEYGDDYYINRDNNEWELCKKNENMLRKTI